MRSPRASASLAVLLAPLALASCRGTPKGRPVSAVQAAAHPENARLREELCADVGEAACLDACPDGVPSQEHAGCLFAFRFGDDAEAAALALSLYERRGTLPGIERMATIDGYAGENVELVPALPTGEDRHHLEWIDASLAEFEAFVTALGPHARGPIEFTGKPRVFRFFRTREPSYPSAYSLGGVVGYNLSGPLFSDHDSVRETLFHELFHVEDERLGFWSRTHLSPVFERILERCGEEHACLVPYAPHDTIVPGGTFYPFDARTRDVREYGAELALRYYREQRKLLEGETLDAPPFKCATEENATAWTSLVDTFFGGADLAPACSAGDEDADGAG